jgi:hypothetical protein
MVTRLANAANTYTIFVHANIEKCNVVATGQSPFNTKQGQPLLDLSSRYVLV